jgi:hypothetical protein
MARAFANGDGVVVALGDAIIDPPTEGGPGIVARLIDAHRVRVARELAAIGCETLTTNAGNL